MTTIAASQLKMKHHWSGVTESGENRRRIKNLYVCRANGKRSKIKEGKRKIHGETQKREAKPERDMPE